MQVATVPASIILRGTSSSTEASAPEDETASDILKLQRTTQALEQMRQTLASSSDEVKTRAQRKLEEAKQELQMLRSSNLPPEVIARMAAELARKVASAASEFASAVATGGSADAAPAADADAAATNPADAATADAPANAVAGAETVGTVTNTGLTPAASADRTGEGDTGLGAGAEETDGAAQARKAYQSVIEDGTPFSGISSDDRETMQEFKAVVQDLKELLEKAMRELRQKGRQGETRNAQSAIDEADAGAGKLAAPAGIFSASPLIPASIVV